MTRAVSHPRWGNSPWSIDFQPAPGSIPAEADFAVVGGGFSGLIRRGMAAAIRAR